MIKKGSIRIGTSNVVVPGNKTTFPAAFQSKSQLNYYASIFNTVEVNSSFYKIPQRSTCQKWALDTPDDFRFTLKLTRDVTHAKELKGNLAIIGKFMHAADGIGERKGCLLIQFPGRITLDYFEKVERILQEVQAYDPDNEWKKAVEFRHNSWYTGEAWELLDEYKAAMVLHDIPKSKMQEVRGHAGFVYLRFHGPKGDYRDSYTDRLLEDKAAEMKQWVREGKDVYVYFNNTMGSAYENARSLQSMLKTVKRKTGHAR